MATVSMQIKFRKKVWGMGCGILGAKSGSCITYAHRDMDTRLHAEGSAVRGSLLCRCVGRERSIIIIIIIIIIKLTPFPRREMDGADA